MLQIFSKEYSKTTNQIFPLAVRQTQVGVIIYPMLLNMPHNTSTGINNQPHK